MIRKTSINFIVFLLLLLSCVRNNDPLSFGEKDTIIPLSVGNNWVYVDSLFSEDSVRVDTCMLKVIGKTKIYYQNEQVYVFITEWPHSNGQYLFKNENGGLYFYGEKSNDYDTVSKSLYLKYPVNVADQWPYIIQQVNDTIYIECTSTDITFSTPLGKFTCVEYHYIQNDVNSNLDVFLYVKPKIGLIGYVEILDNKVLLKRTLISKNIND